jgi:peptidoglycan hydrolase CwlO-like protein
MHARVLVLLAAAGITIGPVVASAQQLYNACEETSYDSPVEPCGGGHQQDTVKRDEASLELSRHRHRYLEDKLKKLEASVDKLQAEVDALNRKAAP